MGTAVALSLASHLAAQNPPVLFSGIVLVAPFTSVERLTATYRLAGTIPILSPAARYPSLLKSLNRFIADKWDSKERIASLIQSYNHVISSPSPLKYHITIIHAIDDYDIHYSHSDELYSAAINATTENGVVSYNHLEHAKHVRETDLGEGGRVTEWSTDKGVIRKQICKHGLHDRIMGYPVVSLAVSRAFENGLGMENVAEVDSG